MKKLIMLLVFGTMISASVYAGGLWSIIKNTGIETRHPKTFTIEVEGVNIRAYVFDVPEMKSVCINIWGEDLQTLECKTYKEMGLKEKE